MTNHLIDDWTGCYPSNWKGVIVPEAMTHPAKFSSKLIRRIYEHLRDEGWIKPGDTVVDPFGGVALGACHAVLAGLNWYGVELEEKFYKLGNANIEKWQRDFKSMPLGEAHLFHGDSRHLLEVIRGATVAVNSPPYAESLNAGKGGIDWEKAGRPDRLTTEAVGIQGANGREEKYGSTPGQLGAMKVAGFDAAISSSPYAGMEVEKNSKSIDRAKQYEIYKKSGGGQTFEQFCHTQDIHSQGYGESDGQLASMPAVEFDTALSSPPYNDSRINPGNVGRAIEQRWGSGRSLSDAFSDNYGTVSEGQLGGTDDFWLAARQIVEQVYIALRPGGHAVWVVKDYVKNKEIVPFCDQWRQLCEAVGLETLHEHHTLLVRNKRTQIDLEGNHITTQSESKSFFRRVAEKKGSPRIDYEVVLCMVKPERFRIREDVLERMKCGLPVLKKPDVFVGV